VLLDLIKGFIHKPFKKNGLSISTFSDGKINFVKVKN
jgi:hypothetical protein